jgi:excinuclease ABC subunit B
MWGEQIEALSQIDPLFGQIRQTYDRLPVYPRTHYVLPREQREEAISRILHELEWWRPELEKQGKPVEAQRIQQRTMFDVEMMKEIGYCHGIENYSHATGLLPARRVDDH